MQRGSLFIAVFAHLTRRLIVARIPTRPGGGDDQVAKWVGAAPEITTEADPYPVYFLRRSARVCVFNRRTKNSPKSFRMQGKMQPMTLGEYAESQIRFGANVVCRGGHYWRQIRPFFYRPLLPVTAISSQAIARAPISWPRGYQYVVEDGAPANSFMNFVMLDNLSAYRLENLSQKRRQVIARAAKKFEVRPIANAPELKAQGHAVYLSFFQRTGYAYKAERVQKPAFDQWADDLFKSSKTLMIGGYNRGRLVAFSTWYWVERTLVYTTLVSETDAMREDIGELMFHEVRDLAGKQHGLDEIFLRNYQGGNSIDQYHLFRGAQLVRKPAQLCVPFPVLAAMRQFAPRKHELLLGRS
jgi:hypothetical protein